MMHRLIWRISRELMTGTPFFSFANSQNKATHVRIHQTKQHTQTQEFCLADIGLFKQTSTCFVGLSSYFAVLYYTSLLAHMIQ